MFRVLGELQASGDTREETRRALASKAFAHTAAYDTRITAFLRSRGFDQSDSKAGAKVSGACVHSDSGGEEAGAGSVLTLRYGMNPHQTVARLSNPTGGPLPLTGSAAFLLLSPFFFVKKCFLF